MNTKERAIPIADHEAQNPAAPDGRRRHGGITWSRYLPIATLTLVSLVGSVAWCIVGGWWWFPFCIMVSSVSMVAVLWSVCTGWMQRKAIHQKLDSTEGTPIQSRASASSSLAVP